MKKFFESAKEGWENIWLPRIQEGKTKIELERDKQYEAKWVWYHTLLAMELLVIIVLLLWIAIVITVKSRLNSLALEIISNVPELNSLLFTSQIIKVFILL